MLQESKLSELHEVCAVGDVDMLEDMLLSGRFGHLDYKDPDWEERAPLHWCCIKGKSDMTMNLLEKGAHPGIRSSSGWTPAHFAAEGGRTHVLRMLHQFNAPMDRKDLFGDTPRSIALVYGHKDVVDFLLTAEREYRVWRRKAELSREVEVFDDEDLEWCYKNNITPERFITEDELAEITSTITSLSVISENPSTTSKGRSKGHHYPRQSRAGSTGRQASGSGRRPSSSRPGSKKQSRTGGKGSAKTKKKSNKKKK